jgi:hypothetical protein
MMRHTRGGVIRAQDFVKSTQQELDKALLVLLSEATTNRQNQAVSD